MGTPANAQRNPSTSGPGRAARYVVLTLVLGVGHGLLDAAATARPVLENPWSAGLFAAVHHFLQFSVALSLLHLAALNAASFLAFGLLARLGLRLRPGAELAAVTLVDVAFLAAAQGGVEFYDAKGFGSPIAVLRLGSHGALLLLLGVLAWLAQRRRRRPGPVSKVYAALFVVGLATPLVYAYSPPVTTTAPSNRPNVVLVVIDTLRAESMGIYGHHRANTPHLERLVETAGGIVFDRAYVQYTSSTGSHTAIYTGCYPTTHQIRANGDTIPETLQLLSETFREAGYYTAGFHNHHLLNQAYGFGQGFDTFVETHDPSLLNTRPLVWKHQLHLWRAYEILLAGEPEVAFALDWLRSDPSRPFFLWYHTGQPHASYRPPQRLLEQFYDKDYDGPMDGSRDRSVDYASILTDEDLEYMRALYDAEVAYADEDFNKLVEALKKTGAFENTLIVFTSDHGESLGDHGFYFVHGDLYEESVHVPLVLVMPGKLPQRRIRESVQVVDMAATVLRLTGLSDEERFCDGRDLSELWTGDAVRPPVLAWKGSAVTAIDEDWKLLLSSYPDGEPTLYDLANDPEESVDVASQHPETVLRLRAAIDGVCLASEQALDYCSASKEIRVDELDTETLEQLRSLGYID